MEVIVIRIGRIALAVALSVGMLYFLSRNDLQGWLLPYLLFMGLMSAIVAGSHTGLAVSTVVLIIWAAVDLMRTVLIFGPYQRWNVAAVIQSHWIEGLVIYGYFVAVSFLGGLLGWGLSRAGFGRFHR